MLHQTFEVVVIVERMIFNIIGLWSEVMIFVLNKTELGQKQLGLQVDSIELVLCTYAQGYQHWGSSSSSSSSIRNHCILTVQMMLRTVIISSAATGMSSLA